MRKRFFLLGMADGGVPGLTLPYTFDPSALSDGALPTPWVGSTWSIASGRAINSPTLGAELLTDGGLEATYTDGKCDSLATPGGSPTLAQSATVHGGSKAQEFTGTGINDNLYFPAIIPLAHRWYQFSVWAKRTAGAAGNTIIRSYQANSVPASANQSIAITSAAYAQYVVTKRTIDTSNFIVYPAIQPSVAGYDTVLADDCSCKLITTATMAALVDTHITDMIAKTKWDWTGRQGISGVVAKADATMSNFLVAYYYNYNYLYTYCVLDKCVNGVYTQLVADWSNSPSAGGGDTPTASQWLEIRVIGTTISLWHNESQVGTNQTVNDATITPNTLAGAFSSGGNGLLASFFVSA